MRDIDEDGKGIFCYGRIVFHEELQVLYGLELVALEERQVGLRVAQQIFCSDLPYLRVPMVSGGSAQILEHNRSLRYSQKLHQLL